MGLFVGLSFLMLALVQEPASPSQPAIESGYVEAGEGRLYYDTAGHGPVVVLIHDGLVHRETWESQFPLLARTHHVIRYDRRGYGRSDIPAKPFSNVEDLHTLLTSLKVERATLIGCSMGGLLSIQYTLAHPERVSGLILVGPIVSGYGFSDHFRARGDRGKPGPEATVEQQIEYWTTTDPWIMAPGSTGARHRMKELLAANPRNLTLPYNLLRGPKEPAAGQLSRISTPTLIIVGEQDIPDVHAHAGVIEAGIPGARRVVMTGAGHLVHMEVPDAFNRIVLEFLAGPKK